MQLDVNYKEKHENVKYLSKEMLKTSDVKHVVLYGLEITMLA
jgi:hypothetical protein